MFVIGNNSQAGIMFAGQVTNTCNWH